MLDIRCNDTQNEPAKILREKVAIELNYVELFCIFHLHFSSIKKMHRESNFAIRFGKQQTKPNKQVANYNIIDHGFKFADKS